ncbi:uncharacterized protein FOMMEDRAFT_144843 [Fomitiporia mediterranea MF3/22]|uniref:uncharacterized protein n=1 Tax=Fomitiporia mediterranea (strain MF3/22) TaxID=694068 RepID=UPI0004409A9E|nr:uncharacterized protein FOMMEDRAFT_144843 [Fomitiporia mediterranea MF3/22]EJD07061.1 hypothetical protein FOMMEDRAFT_144843 [Fomitiporia mediterranea MF3/22]
MMLLDVTVACDPAGAADRANALAACSPSSNGSSSRGSGSAVRMKTRKGAAALSPAKARVKELRQVNGAPSMQRTHSNSRIYRLQAGPGGLTGGTIQRSKMGGRTAAASAHLGTLPGSLYSRQFPVRQPATQTISQRPAPAAVSKLAQEEKSTTSTSNGLRPGSARRTSSSSRRSSKSGSSKGAKGAKTNGHPLPSSSLKQKKGIDFADDSDYSTDTEWDTEDASEEADGTSGENEQVATDRKLVEAAAEAQRQRDMFAKVDRRSYSDLSRVRTQPGLLSVIFHPDPQLFPPDHPYRHSRSTQDILAHVSRPSYQSVPLQPSKSAVAVPVAATVTAQGVGSPEQSNTRQRSPLRLKGRPQDVEESDSGEDDEENKLHVSESVAQKRLAMLHRQNMKGRQAQDPSKPAQKCTAPQQAQQSNVLPAAGQRPLTRRDAPGIGPSPLVRVATEPIPLGYPYNLPPPVPPSTPRTIRRNMLTHELSESLRRNLLWERQVSKQRPMGLGRRMVSNSAAPRPGPTNRSAAPSVNGHANNIASQPNGTAVSDQVVKEDRHKEVFTRNRSWADNFHVSGW